MSSATPASNRAIYLRLIRYVRPYRKVFALALLGMALTALTEPLFPALMKPLLDQGFVPGNHGDLYLIPLALVGIFLVRGCLTYFTSYAMAWVTNRLIMDLRRQMFDRLLTLPTRFYDDQSSGVLISRVTYGVTDFTSAATTVLTALVRDSLTVTGLLAYMLYYDWKLTLIALSVGPLIVTVVRKFGKRLRAATRRGYDAMAQISHILEETIGAHKVVKIFGGQHYEARRFEDVGNEFRHAAMRESMAASATVPLTQLASAIALAVIIYVALLQSSQNNVTVGGFVSFMTAMLMLLAPVKRLTEMNAPLQRGLTSAENIFALLDQVPEDDQGTQTLPRSRNHAITFERIGFCYEGATRPALQDISLSVPAGQTVALVGPSGSGKTTLATLLPRFYNAEHGHILIDGHDVQELTLTSLRSAIALVSQDVVLFNDTVAANIAYGAAAGASELEIVTAAKAANAWEFIRQMPQGLATVVGENGVKLSGGQRQRLAIARAFLKNAPILILDEATSALDTESERQIQAALENLIHGRTTLVIAHRLSTVEHADRIIVLDKGRIVEEGRHSELLALGGLYSHLYRLQFEAAA
ncbi:MAG: lipid A export permease/ATP-binding protein MsbA [Sterolibacterium sp.]|nr:lipid A export permease/ATP-binding protein MsbA [Sterolibacterium sp.]MBP9799919.1 lipid A export permease/ATP-binding protein MsbA [Sterolibacterium sp.]